MPITSPHYLLLSEARHTANQDNAWRFVLENVNSLQRMAAADIEPHAGGERLELLAVVRGLEAIDCPARVTLITKSRYVNRGLKYGMNEWRSTNWQWERFGKLVPVRDHDLWQRVDRALQFHQVQCRTWQFAAEAEHDDEAPPRQPTTKNCAVPSSRNENFPIPKRRFDSSHHAHPRTASAANPREQSTCPPASRKVPCREISRETSRANHRDAPNQKRFLNNRRLPGVMARIKGSFHTWLVTRLNALLTDSQLSKHRLQPLS
jgi:ribonuclease HI